MTAFHDLIEEWRFMKARLEQQLETLGGDAEHPHGPFAKETIQRWIVELDDLIIKYSFEI